MVCLRKFSKNIYLVLTVSLSIVFFCNYTSTAATAKYAEYYVSVDGNDSFSGKLPSTNSAETDGPFATLERARDAIRQLKKAKQFPVIGVITVNIRGGEYTLKAPFELSAKDSGSENSPIEYRAYNNEKVKIIGAKEIKGFKPVADAEILKRIDGPYRSKIMEVNLREQGITVFGELKPRGFGRSMSPAGLELFFNDKPMQLARWPNKGWVTIAGVPEGQNGGNFNYEGDRPERWLHADDVWLHGFWTWDWADSYEKIKQIDISRKEFKTYEPHSVFGYSKGKRYYALNILEELDEPGEWCLDRKSGILYFWPPTPLRDGKAYVSLLNTLINIKDVSHVSFQGLELGMCRGTAVKISGGAHNRIAGCTLRNIGNAAIEIDGGRENGVVGCNIYNCGEGGVRLNGGDRKSLSAGNNYVRNCDIHDYNQSVKTYRPAILINGVGNIISNNHIHDAPHEAIELHGNDHIVELNEIHHVCLETEDAGAFYMGRDYSELGNVIRFNFFHHIGENNKNVSAIYLDDFASGTEVMGNIIFKAGIGVQNGGGHHNAIRNNIFIECLKAAVHIDARGLTWAKKYFDGRDNTLWERLKTVEFSVPPFSERYPYLARVVGKYPQVPKEIIVKNNLYSHCIFLELHDGANKMNVAIVDNNVCDAHNYFDAQKITLKLLSSLAVPTGFDKIPVEKIGLYGDEFRDLLHGK